ncbi:hypothetical protein [Mycobacterium simiae]|uniref:hypothetical protein n=1 Tax=Mycobacterium simiae TaxID=1784 RepID=UPI001CB6BBE5|nr:hypothetical protein [Mycobacterium simiae]
MSTTPPRRRRDDAQVEVIEHGLADQPAIAQLELVQMRTVPAGERGVDGVSELAELVGTGGEDPTRARPNTADHDR